MYFSLWFLPYTYPDPEMRSDRLC